MTVTTRDRNVLSESLLRAGRLGTNELRGDGGATFDFLEHLKDSDG